MLMFGVKGRIETHAWVMMAKVA